MNSLKRDCREVIVAELSKEIYNTMKIIAPKKPLESERIYNNSVNVGDSQKASVLLFVGSHTVKSRYGD